MDQSPLEKLKTLVMDFNLKDALKGAELAKGIFIGCALGIWYAATWVSNVNARLDTIQHQQVEQATALQAANLSTDQRLDRLDEKLYELVSRTK